MKGKTVFCRIFRKIDDTVTMLCLFYAMLRAIKGLYILVVDIIGGLIGLIKKIKKRSATKK